MKIISKNTDNYRMTIRYFEIIEHILDNEISPVSQRRIFEQINKKKLEQIFIEINIKIKMTSFLSSEHCIVIFYFSFCFFS